MIEFISIGIILGLSAGLAPGPLLTLVISETLRYDIRAGIKVALSPLLTDLPIILLSILVLTSFADSAKILGIISLAGGCFVLYMGIEGILQKPPTSLDLDNSEKSLFKGILTNALSPHPYLFWMTVGGPIIKNAGNDSFVSLVAFLSCFYGLLVSSKIMLAVITGKSAQFLNGKTYRTIMIILGLALCALSFLLLYDGFKLLGLVK